MVAENPIEHQESIENTIDPEPIVSESEPEIETTSDTTEEVSTLSLSESNEDMAGLPKEEVPPASISNIPIEVLNQLSEYEISRANAMAEKERASQEKLNKVIAYTKQTLVLYLDETALNRLCEYVTEYYLSDTIDRKSTRLNSSH